MLFLPSALSDIAIEHILYLTIVLIYLSPREIKIRTPICETA